MIQKGDHILIAGLGIEFAIIMCLGFFAGRWIDLRLNSSPWGLLVCCAAAFALGLYLLTKTAQNAVKKTEKKAEDKE
ncbi:MAG: AtpZ/AtpI family protein [Elusimicrobiota bacterium]|jgi:F0F1-type ATP synthase assembly protein I|nr:AtpZ/AtpI family protein [Elusimicrobiota bacterium]